MMVLAIAVAARLELALPGGFKLPAWHDKPDRPFSKFWEDLHEKLAWGLFALFIVHVAAALRHRFIKGNDVMAHMWSGRARSGK